MSRTLQTRNVVIDTCIFVGANFNYSSPPFARLIELAREDKIAVYTTNILTREIKANIREQVRQASTAAKKFRRDARILRNTGSTGFGGIFHSLDTDALEQTLIAQFEDFLQEANIRDIPVDYASVSDVFVRYFDHHPPFGEGRNKSEFPDAFFVSTMEQWCSEHGEKAYVISQDKGVQDACCPPLFALGNVEDFIDIVMEEEERRLYSAARDWFEAHQTLVTKGIAEAFDGLGFWLEDLLGEVCETEAQDVSIHSASIVEVKDTRATWSLDVEIEYQASISYEDPSSGIWDSEDRVWFGRETVQTEVTKTINVPIELGVSFSPQIPDRSQIEDLVINKGEDIAVSPWEEYR